MVVLRSKIQYCTQLYLTNQCWLRWGITVLSWIETVVCTLNRDGSIFDTRSQNRWPVAGISNNAVDTTVSMKIVPSFCMTHNSKRKSNLILWRYWIWCEIQNLSNSRPSDIVITFKRSWKYFCTQMKGEWINTAVSMLQMRFSWIALRSHHSCELNFM